MNSQDIADYVIENQFSNLFFWIIVIAVVALVVRAFVKD